MNTLTVTMGGKVKTFQINAKARGHMAPAVRFHADKRRQSRSEDRREVRQNWRDF